MSRILETLAAPGRNRLAAPQPLPEITEPPRAAWLAGWWSGIGVGLVLGIAAAVIVARA